MGRGQLGEATGGGWSVEALFTELLPGLKTAGPFVMLLTYLWLSERAERRKVQEERDGYLERVLKGMSDSTDAVRASTAVSSSTERTLGSLKEYIIRGKGEVL